MGQLTPHYQEETRVPLELFTGRYQAFQPSMGVPVRTTVGAPRWKLAYPLQHNLPEVTPTREMVRGAHTGGWSQAKFEVAYRARLTEIGPARIIAAAEIIAHQAGTGRLVLLCFDDVSKQGVWCHRLMFGRWWVDVTGQPVPELGPVHPTLSRAATADLPCDVDPDELPPGDHPVLF